MGTEDLQQEVTVSVQKWPYQPHQAAAGVLKRLRMIHCCTMAEEFHHTAELAAFQEQKSEPTCVS